ncbi:MAG TPA: hypothetical protein VGR67_02540 [Candidatus Polarisedimenticolia bacterium]|nr:hypothetical protein [Candidatus Polarisedimenticolia bacterium]
MKLRVSLLLLAALGLQMLPAGAGSFCRGCAARACCRAGGQARCCPRMAAGSARPAEAGCRISSCAAESRDSTLPEIRPARLAPAPACPDPGLSGRLAAAPGPSDATPPAKPPATPPPRDLLV